MASDPQFTVFRSLPSEIRIKIWKDALPGRDWVFEPLIFPFQRGCWKIETKLTPSEREDVPEPFIESFWKFDDSLLDKPKCKVNIGAVNREAREVAITWVRTLGSSPNNTLNPVFIRPFVGGSDGLYVSADQWEDFANEPTMISKHYARELCHITSNITRLVLPESVLRTATPSEVRGAFLFFRQIREIFIIPDGSDDGAASGEAAPSIRGCSLEPRVGGYAFSWSPELGSFLSLFPTMCRREKMAGYIDGFLRQLVPVLDRIPRLEVRNAVVGPHINETL